MRPGRLPFVFLAMLSLIAGLIAGLQRIGWSLPVEGVASSHGAIMIGGFLGTLITLEKIIPLKKNLLYVIPVISAASVVFSFFGMTVYSTSCLLFASAGLSIIFLIYWTRERSLIYALMFLGAACWLTGNIFFVVNHFYPVAVPWWMAFVLLIISSERLELMKFLPVSTPQKLFFISILLIFLIACVLSFHGAGNYFAAFSLVAAPVWLMRYDVVSINLKKDDLSKYVGISLLSGYAALLFCGILIPFLTTEPLGYDALVHIFFTGFVFSMIFAHGPIILPGVLGISVKPFHPVLYLWLTLLHASWLIRTFSDMALEIQLRKYSGLLSAIAIVGYFLSIATIIIRSRRAEIV
jgi:hypothetical protein